MTRVMIGVASALATRPDLSDRLSAHAALAAALGGACAFAETLAGPLLAPVVALGSAALTAGIAVHAVHRTARVSRVPAGRLLRDVAVAASSRHGDHLAAHALDLASRVHHRERSAWVHGAALVGRCAGNPVRAAVKHLTFGWCTSFGHLRAASGALGASRAALHGAGFLGCVQAAAREAVAGIRSEGGLS